MSRQRATAFFVFVLSTLASPAPVRAEKRTEAGAREAIKKAERDYVSANYSAGAARLEKALRACGVKRCAPKTQALLLRDIGALQFESGDSTAAAASFAKALALQPSLELSSTYDEPALRDAWDAAKNAGSGPATAPVPGDLAPANAATTEHAPENAPENGPEKVGRAPAAEQEAPPPDDQTPGNSEAPGSAPAEPVGVARLWVGLAGTIDFLNVPAGDDVCKLSAAGQPGNTAGFYCTNPDGTDFPSRASPAENALVATRGQAGRSDGGIEVGDRRAMLAVDYALTPNLLAGARFGYVLGSYTGEAAVKDGRAFGPRLHAELRATYVFGRSAGEGFSPLAFAAAGVSEFDGSSVSAVTVSGVAGQRPVNVWLTGGPFFAAIGGGMRYLFSPRVAFTAAARLNAALGGNAVLPTFGPEIAVQYGF